MGTRRPSSNLISAVLVGLLGGGNLGAEVFSVGDLSAGVYDTVPGNMIPDGAATAITNFHVDPYSKGLIQRGGSSKKNSSQLSGSGAVDVFTYVQQDGDEYIIAFASKTINYSSDNGASFTTLITTGVDAAYWDCAGFVDDRFYCVTQSTSAFRFDGTTHFVTTQTPAGKFIESYENRLWVANTAANPGRLFFSNLLLPSTYTTSTDYIDFDEPITGLGVINGGLSVYGDNNVWVLRGDDPTNYNVDKISRGIGCANNRTIKNMMLKGEEVQVFLSKGYGQSKNNFYANTGIQVIPIGDNYLTTLAGINIGNSSARSKTWTLTADFSAGTFDQTYTSSDSVRISTTNVDISNPSFETGTSTDADNWTESVDVAIRTSTDTTAQSGSYLMSGMYDRLDSFGHDCSADQTATNGTVAIYDGSGSFLEAVDIGSITSAYQQKTINLSAYSGRTIYTYLTMRKAIEMGAGHCGPLGTVGVAQSDNFVASGSSMTFYVKAYGTGNKRIAYDLFASGQNTISSGTFTSEVYQTDSGLSQWGNIDIDYDVGTGSMTFYIRVATGSAELAAASYQEITDDHQISTTTGRFVQWKVTMSSFTSLTTPPVLNGLTLNWVSSSGSSQQPDAEVFKENYWMTYPGSSESRNQSILVINKDGAMYNLEYGTSSQNGFYGLTTSRGLLFAGDSSTSTTGGYVWQLETGNLDDGQSITASVRFKDQEFSTANLDDYEKSLVAVYINYGVQTSGSFTATVYTNFSEGSSSYSVPLSSGTTVNRYKIEPNQQTTGRQIALQFSNSTSGQSLNLYPPITYHFEKVRLIKQQR